MQSPKNKLKRRRYEIELMRLSHELVKFQYWVREKGMRVVITFDGRDAAGKGGTIKRVTEPLNPRGCRVVALDRAATSATDSRFWSHTKCH